MLFKTCIKYILLIFIINFPLLSFSQENTVSIKDSEVKKPLEDEKDEDIKLAEEAKDAEEPSAPFEMIEPNFDNPPHTLDENLQFLEIKQYSYEPFFNSISILLDIYSFLEYGSSLFFENIDYLNPSLGLGLLLKKGIYASLQGGYGYIDAKSTLQMEKAQEISYTTKGPFFEIGLGLLKKYKRASHLGFIIKYGATFYRGAITKKNYNKDLNSHWLKLLINSNYKPLEKFNIYIGSEFGIKFLIKTQEFYKEINKFLIPGYGYNKNTIGFTFSLYLQYILPLSLDLISVN